VIGDTRPVSPGLFARGGRGRDRVWLWSHFVIPGGGLLRAFLLLAAVFVLLRPYGSEYQAASRDHPLDATLWGSVIAVWLFAVLGAVLSAQSRGYHVPTARGPYRPIGFLILIAPFLFPVASRFIPVYVRLGRASS
jgi:hypothetical protein